MLGTQEILGMARRPSPAAVTQRKVTKPEIPVHACYGAALLRQPIPGLPELDLIGHTEVQKPMPGLAAPFREGTLNLYLGYKGSKTISVPGREFTLAGGDIFVTPPGVQHQTPALPMTKCAHYWLRVRLDLKRPFLGDAGLAGLRQALSKADIYHSRYSPQDLLAVRAIYDLCNAAASALRDLQVRMQLGLLLVQLVRRMEAPVPTTGANSPTQAVIDLVTGHLKRHVGEDLGVQEMADIAGMSVSALQAIFRSRIGMPPGEYFIRLKMDEARRLLRETDLSVRHISQILGYRSERYFSAAFRRFFPLPPGRFRRQAATVINAR